MAAPSMPAWASEDGPWCLKMWLALPSGPDDGYTLCVREPDHDGDCKDWFDVEHRPGRSLLLGDDSDPSPSDGGALASSRPLGALRGDTRITVATERDQTEEDERL